MTQQQWFLLVLMNTLKEQILMMSINMRVSNCILIISAILFSSISYSNFDLLTAKKGEKKIRKIMWNANGGPFSSKMILESEKKGVYYWLSKGGALGLFDINSAKNINGWALNRWPTEYNDKAISEINKHPFTHGKRGAELYDEYSSHAGTGSDANVGCLGEKPLRYGDVDDEGSKEIVLYLSEFDQKSDWVLFSPKKEKIIFSMRWQAKDFYKGDELAYYQYPSLENQSSSQNRGFQVFAKAFLGDFNKDKVPDILVWRKRFESLVTGASKKGFELKGENFEHYSLVDGEYQPQVTIPLKIKNWLADAELTWQKGYPSKSECAGQEGQLIPEMHDPLLNDPDVLK